jgi:serine/threonine protein kinase
MLPPTVLLLAPGTVLQDRYEVIRPLGQGGFGAVYEAEDKRLGHHVALKQNVGGDREQFLQEAMILAKLSHPNLPRVTDHFVEPNGSQYLVMDFVDGEDLEAKLAKQSRLDEKQMLDWFDQILSAVAYLHSQKVIHRDIKPANIKLTPTGQATLVDFGIAKVLTQGEVTRSGAKAVTPGYAAPEQFEGGSNQYSDIYSLGATLYKLLSGTTPPNALGLKNHSAQLTPPRRLNRSITKQTEQVILKAMEVDPALRFQSTDEMRRMLNAAKTSTRALALPMGMNGWVFSIAIIAVIVVTGFLMSWCGIMSIIFPPAASASPTLMVAVVPTQMPTREPSTRTLALMATSTAMSTSTPTPTIPRTATSTPTPILLPPTATAMSSTTATSTSTESPTWTPTWTLVLEPSQTPGLSMQQMVQTQVAAALTALVPTATATSTPTITLTPTNTSTATPTFLPGVQFVTLRWEPYPAYAGDWVVFVAQFHNTLGVLQQIRWRIEIMDIDVPNPTWTKLFFVTYNMVSDINPGRYEFRTDPAWRIPATSGKRNFMLHVMLLDDSNNPLRVLSTPYGQVDFPLRLVPR